MPNYRRNFVPGGTYFFTVVTHERRPIFTDDLARSCLRKAIQDELEVRPFDNMAICLLPDHFHTVWTLPPGDSDYPLRLNRIKAEFTRAYLKQGGTEGDTTLSRLRKGERAVWQRRFWEHTCEDEDDLKRCLDYTHWNPVKHGLVERVQDYPYSTFLKFVKLGEYPLNWGSVDPCPDYHTPEWE